MKNTIIALLLFPFSIPGYSQNSRFEYFGRTSPAIIKGKLIEAKFITEIMPGFSRYVALPHQEKVKLDERIKIVDLQRENYVYPRWNCVRAKENYEEVIDFVFIEVAAICNGIRLSAQTNCAELSASQKNILNAADPGTDIHVKVKFKYKNWLNENATSCGNIKEGAYTVSLIPETEAQYPGGYQQLSEYINENLMSKLTKKNSLDKIQRAVVKFTVSEQGQIINPKISQTSTDPVLDKMVLDVINKMPKWRPAKDLNGIKIKQEFCIPFGMGC